MKKYKSVTILMAEDDPDDRLLITDALRESKFGNGIYFVEDGLELLDYLYQRNQYEDKKQAPRPGLILLDLNMPRMDGREALEEIKANPNLRRIPVVVLTTSQAEEDIVKTYDLGVGGFITKPMTFDGLVKVVKSIGRYWLHIVELPPP